MDLNISLNKESKVKKKIKEAAVFLLEIIIVIIVAYFFVNNVFSKTKMIGDSMKTTLSDGDEIIVNMMSYKLSSPRRYDVIVFKQTGNSGSFYDIKRVIGLPGETVEINNGVVYINGKELEEVIAVDKMIVSGIASSQIKLGKGEFFVLGDNRNNSEDSRYASVGTVEKSEIIGKAFVRINPPGLVNRINRKDK